MPELRELSFREITRRLANWDSVSIAMEKVHTNFGFGTWMAGWFLYRAIKVKTFEREQYGRSFAKSASALESSWNYDHCHLRLFFPPSSTLYSPLSSFPRPPSPVFPPVLGLSPSSVFLYGYGIINVRMESEK